MRPSLLAIVLLLPLVACSVENGGKIFQPTPSGTIQLRLVGGGGGVISSGPAHPFKVTGGTFSLWVNEQWYSDYFTATVVSWTGSGNPCWQPPTKPNNTVLTFTGSCSRGAGVEGIRVSDIFQNQTVQYFTAK